MELSKIPKQLNELQGLLNLKLILFVEPIAVCQIFEEIYKKLTDFSTFHTERFL